MAPWILLARNKLNQCSKMNASKRSLQKGVVALYLETSNTWNCSLNLIKYIYFHVSCFAFRSFFSVFRRHAHKVNRWNKSSFITFQICPGLNANEIQIPYDKRHKVSSLQDPFGDLWTFLSLESLFHLSRRSLGTRKRLRRKKIVFIVFQVPEQP